MSICGESVMQWIKVEDKLPEATRTHEWRGPISDQVLCAIKCTTKEGTRYIVKEGHYAHKYNYWAVPGSQHEVVAWMPMPEYKGE